MVIKLDINSQLADAVNMGLALVYARLSTGPKLCKHPTCLIYFGIIRFVNQIVVSYFTTAARGKWRHWPGFNPLLFSALSDTRRVQSVARNGRILSNTCNQLT
jgi:hypothetical protein